MTADALIGPLIGAAVAIGSALIVHAVMDAYKHGRMETKIENLEKQVGTRETGLAGSLHKQGNIIAKIQGVLMFISEKLKITVKRDDE